MPLDEIEKVAREQGVDLTTRNALLIGYLLGRAATDDRRLLTDREHLRAYGRNLMTRLP